MPSQRSPLWVRAALATALAVVALLWLAPLFWALVTSLKEEGDTTAVPIELVPENGFTLQAYRSAQRLAPQSALPRAHVGEALLFMGKVPEALKELKAAMDLEPEGDGARLAQSLLEAKEAGALPPPAARR